MKYRKKLIIVDAFQMTSDFFQAEINCEEVQHEDWFQDAIKKNIVKEDASERKWGFVILHGQRCDLLWNDWIIKGINGEIYPCKEDIFEKTYEKI